MRWDYLKLRGIGPFRDEVEIDFTKLGDARLVAIVGQNGAGKSTLLEVGLPGAMDRSTPTRGSLLSLATRRDSLVETRLVNGSNYTIRHLLDGVSGKSEALVLKDGEPVLPNTLVRGFDKWRAEHLPSSEVLFASTFSAQDSKGFLESSRTERVGVILRLAQADHLEAKAEGARKRATKARGEFEVLTARIADERARAGDPVALEAQITDLRQGVQSARDELAKLEAEHVAATESYRVYREELARAEAQRAARAEASAEHEQAVKRLCDLDDRARNNRAVIAQGDEIRAAVARVEVIRVRCAEIDQQLAVAKAEADGHRSAAETARQALTAARRRVDSANKRLAGGAGLRVAAGGLDEVLALQKSLTDELADAEADLKAVSGKRVAGAEERVLAMRSGLTSVVEAFNEANESLRQAHPTSIIAAAERMAETAVQTLEADAETERDAKALPAELADAERRVDGLRERTAQATRAVAQAQTAATRLPDLDAASAEVDAAEAEGKAASDRSAEEDRLADVAVRALDPLSRERAQLTQETDQLRPLAGKAEPLAKAEARLAELEPQVATAAAELARLKAKLEELPEPAPITAVSAPAPFDRAGGEGLIETWVKRCSATEAKLEAAHAGAARVSELETERAALELDLSDWNQLASDLGKDGIQALEVDAAGPELTDLCNDLLERCHGPRFRVRIDTQRASADGKRLLEGCDVNVLDTQEGRDAEGSTFSGGERVILGEALSLALAMYGCQRSGETEHSLIRDESGAALDPEAMLTYTAMLRRAAEIVNARVFVVSHTPALWDLCDARITVRERGVEIAS